MKNTANKICFAFVVFYLSSFMTMYFVDNNIDSVSQKVADMSGIDNLQAHSFSMTTIGPMHTVSIRYQASGNKVISAKYRSWFGMEPQMKCYSESAQTNCKG